MVYSQSNQRIINNSSNTYSGDIPFYKNMVNKSYTYYSTNDSALVNGAQDTIYSYIVKNNGGKTSIQPVLSEGGVTIGTVALEIIIQTANGGSYSKEPFNIPDSLFKNQYWLTSVSNDIDVVSTSEDSITSLGVLEPIQIPLLDAEFFRVALISGVTHTDTTDVELKLFQRRD